MNRADKRKNRKEDFKTKTQTLLESGLVSDIKKTKRLYERALKYYWQYFHELEYQRNLRYDDIKSELLLKSNNLFEFSKYQRVIKWEHSLHPLSVHGSVLYNGGRFNIGNDVNESVKSFGALYLASDEKTALQEALGKEHPKTLSLYDMTLSDSNSKTIVSVSGRCDSYFNLTKTANLNGLIKIIKEFKISKSLKTEAKKLNLIDPKVVKTSSELKKSLMDKDWRVNPSQLDIPSNSQIFGNLVYSSGIVGILYPSSIENESNCLSIFPKNFQNTDSEVVLNDKPPNKNLPKIYNKDNFKLLFKSELK